MKTPLKHYWSSLYDVASSPKDIGWGRRSLVKWIFTKRMYYADEIFFQLFNEYVKPQAGSKLVELGSAPGKRLPFFYERYGLVPYGVDYSESGVEKNKELFIKAGLDARNVILADIFDKNFQHDFHDYFDVVYSHGLVEHFSTTSDIIRKHLNLLRVGGYLVVVIPNLRGMINWLITWFFNRALIGMHNLDIMNRVNFEDAFSDLHLNTKYLNYYGFFTFHLFNAPPKTIRCRILFIMNVLQLLVVDPISRLLKIGERGNSVYSPYLIYIGRKTQ